MFKNSDFDQAIVQWIDEHAFRGVMTTDASLVICGWNRWLEEKSGILADAVIGRHVFEAFPDLISRGLNRLFDEALTGQIAVLAQRFHKYLFKFPAHLDSGLPEMRQTAFIAPMKRDGKVVGILCIVDDVSERVVREAELMAAREEATKANLAKDRFIAMLSHDLRTPLTAILGWARVFQERATDEQMVRKGAEAIQRNAALQLGLIEDLLDISRMNSGKLELALEPTDVWAAVNATLEGLEPVARSKGVQLNRVLPPREERLALLDAKRFNQIIWNLISNALKFTPQGGSIRVTLEYAVSGFELTISDTGKGISAENLPRLFELLWQAEDSGGHGGLGLGLAIVKKLVELHDGSIRAESSGLGQGASFIVRIPWSTTRARHAVFDIKVK